MRRILSVSALTAALLLTGCATGGNYGAYQQPTRIETARVVNVQQVATGGSWGYGAAIGGVAGVLTGGGHSNESKLIRGALGALAGAAINKGLTAGAQDNMVMVQTRTGLTLNVRHDSRDLAPGDCVQVETRYNGDVRLFRTSATQCAF